MNSHESKDSGISDKVKSILQGNTDMLLSESKRLGRDLAQNDLSKSQIRNIYSTVKRISSSGQFGAAEQHELKLLIPKIQYAVAREQRGPKAWKSLGEMLTLCIQNINAEQKHFAHFAEFFEAIVAYHYSEHEKRKQERRHYSGGR